MLQGVMLYRTPLNTSGVASCRFCAGPAAAGISYDQATPSLATFEALTWFSGLYRCSDQFMLYVIQSSPVFPASLSAASSTCLGCWATATHTTNIDKTIKDESLKPRGTRT